MSKMMKLLVFAVVLSIAVLPSLLRAQEAYRPPTDKALDTKTITKDITVAGKTYKLIIKEELWVSPTPPAELKSPVEDILYAKEGVTAPTWHEIKKFTIDPLTIPDKPVGYRTSRSGEYAAGKVYEAVPPSPAGSWKKGALLRKAPVSK